MRVKPAKSWKRDLMKSIPLILLLVGVCLFGNVLQAADQEDAKRSAGIINDSLRNEFPAASAWDIGGQFRMRSEAKDSGSFPNRDFVQNLDHSNDYLSIPHQSASRLDSGEMDHRLC